MIWIKRVYDPPAKEDGSRFLVERLWPHGMQKEALQMEAWYKDVAPNNELRRIGSPFNAPIAQPSESSIRIFR